MEKRVCNTMSCNECKSIRGKLYCSKSAKEVANGQRQALLYVKKDAPCFYSK